ncbi:hypothetical protein [Variovorax sp. YR752]|uniref:PKD domain-containing protein n=1 Tax=Variovorax sp. YR752 TaxID=1884383 RepID=UPI003137848A
MKSASKTGGHRAVLLQAATAALLAIASGQAAAAAVTLCAEPYAVNLPGAAGVVMWGYREVADATSCTAAGGLRASAAAPVITLPAGDTTLAVTLVNRLTVPTSVVIAGQPLPTDGGAPVSAVDLVGPGCDPAAGSTADRLACRVRSFTGETEPGATRTYTFDNLRPGSFLLQSGTHPQVQVQMGLFALLREDAPPVDTGARRVYPAPAADAAANFDVDATVLLSEIDPAQHATIAGTLGSDGNQAQWKAGGNSTLNYAPRFFLVNGRVFDGNDLSASDIGISAPNGSRVVLRLANAGLQSRTLMLTDGTWQLLTEDGNRYAAPREQATLLLPAGKTSDAAIVAAGPATVGETRHAGAMFDRRGGTDNGDGSALGGQVARFAMTNRAGPLNRPPVVNAGADQTLTYPTSTTTVTGTVQDDGLPAATTAAWSGSGPGTVSIAAPGALSTGVSFPTTGQYKLRLTAADGEFTTIDEVIVNVQPASADLSISKTDNLASVDAGAAVSYTIVVANAGPQAVSGATVVDTLPATLSSVSWSCAPAAACAVASGTGNLNAVVNLGVGGSATFTVNGVLAASARGTLVNTASVAVPSGFVDPNGANNAATDSDSIAVPRPLLTVLDSFNRGNANTLGGSWQQLVTLGNAGIRVNANQAFCTNSGLAAILCAAGANAYWSPAVFGTQQAAAMTFANTTLNGAGLLLKAGGTYTAGRYSSAIRVRYTTAVPSQVIVETTANGSTYTTQASFPASFASGDTLTAMVDAAGTAYVWKTTATNLTTALGNVTIAGATGSGRVGIFLPPGGRIDNFAGGTVP